jgi:hypothetical protein
VDESKVEQAKKYVERQKGWRPARRTVVYLVVMLVVMVAAGIFLPRLLPGKIQNGQAILGRNAGISVVPLGPGAISDLVHAPPANEGYSAWGMSASREEVVAGWYHQAGGKVDKVSVRSMSGFSGRTQAEWALSANGADPKPRQVGFLPTHNVIWYLASGKIGLVDIKSAQVFDLPLEATDESGAKAGPGAIEQASFSPDGKRLACQRGERLSVVSGFSKVPGEGKLVTRVVLEPGRTSDARGQAVEGTIGSFTWLDRDALVVIVGTGDQRPGSTSVYLVRLASGGVRSVAQIVAAPASGSFTGISRAPRGTDFAVLLDDGKGVAVERYSAAGRRLRTEKLPGGRWSPPLCWGSP